MAEEEGKNGRVNSAQDFRKKAEDLKYHAGIIRDFIVSGKLLALNEENAAESALHPEDSKSTPA